MTTGEESEPEPKMTSKVRSDTSMRCFRCGYTWEHRPLAQAHPVLGGLPDPDAAVCRRCGSGAVGQDGDFDAGWDETGGGDAHAD